MAPPVTASWMPEMKAWLAAAVSARPAAPPSLSAAASASDNEIAACCWMCTGRWAVALAMSLA